MVPWEPPRTLDADSAGYELDDVPERGFVVSDELRSARELVLFTTPVAGNGAGVSFVLDPRSGRCFARAGYW